MTTNNKDEILSHEDVLGLINKKFKKAIIDSTSTTDLCIIITPESLLEIIKYLKDNPKLQFTTFIDLCGVDFPNRIERFDVVYHLLSLRKNKRIRIKTSIKENHGVDSIVEIFPSADWYEREAYDLYGINFLNHPDLRRMLTDYNFQGHPLRKDFPLTGYTQVRYDDVEKRVVHEPVELGQEFRDFDFESPWLGDINQEGYQEDSEVIDDENE
tara:strand:+ start:3802 stop:4440 length:639 start_codon:yes stop_codon:yes gene_type:complete